MIHKSLACLFAAMLGLLAALPTAAADAAAAESTARLTADRPSVVHACPTPAAIRVAEPTSQTDCCKGHKGVCGCRAGKIVCCDGSTSPNCACHGDDGLLN